MQGSDTVWFRLRRAFVNPFTVILFLIAVLSFLTEELMTVSPAQRGMTVPILLCMIVLSGSLRFLEELRAKRVADRLNGLGGVTAEVFRNGSWQKAELTALFPGERLRLLAGDLVPADLKLLEAEELFVSQSSLTGESAVCEKQAGQTLPMGSTIVGGRCVGLITAADGISRFAALKDRLRHKKNSFDRGADSIAWVLIRFMAVLVPAVFLLCGLTQGDWIFAFLFALSVAVGLTPEMLPMVVSACLVKGSAVMAKKECLVKNVSAMQGFGSMDVLCVDKTGTLTNDKLELEYYMDILGNECGRVLDLAWINSLYHTGVENPVDQAVRRWEDCPGKAEHFAALKERFEKLDELPFDHERRFDSVLVGCGAVQKGFLGEEKVPSSEKGEKKLPSEIEEKEVFSGKQEGTSILVVKGSVEEVLKRCSFVEYRGKRELICGKTEQSRAESVHAVVDELLSDGMKVLAVAYKEMGAQKSCSSGDEAGLTLLGYLGFFDAPKKSAEEAVKQLQALQVSVKVLTGDQKETAASVCRRLGIDTKEMLTGAQLLDSTDEALPARIERTSVFAELSPRQKAYVVELLQGNGHTVGYLGDGLNDLPAVLSADVGISVDTAAKAVRESADVILLKKDLGVLGQGILEGRKVFANMSKYIRITASSNFGNILSIVAAGVFLPFLPMTAVQLLLLNLLYDALCLVLPWDPVDEELYRRPREWSGSFLGRFMRFFGPLSSVFDLMTFGFLFFVLCPAVAGGFFPSLSACGKTLFATVFQSGWFLESMWTQVLILYFLRTKRIPLLESRPSVPVLLITACGILLFTFLTYTPLGGILGLFPMPPLFFGFLLLVIVLYAVFVTGAKAWYIRRYQELI